MPTTAKLNLVDTAARLREQAADMIRRAADLNAMADQLDTPCPLRGKAADAAATITTTPGLTGDEVADRIGLAPVTFRRHVVPTLKGHGFTCNARGGGYHPPRPNAGNGPPIDFRDAGRPMPVRCRITPRRGKRWPA